MAVNPNACHRQQGHVSVFAAARKDRERHQAKQQRRRELYVLASVTLKQKHVAVLPVPLDGDRFVLEAFEERLGAFRAVVKNSGGRYVEDVVNGSHVFGVNKGVV